jgi:hypothetical protein
MDVKSCWVFHADNPTPTRQSVASKGTAVTRKYKQHSQGFFTLTSLKPCTILQTCRQELSHTTKPFSRSSFATTQGLDNRTAIIHILFACSTHSLQHPKGPYPNVQEEVCPCQLTCMSSTGQGWGCTSKRTALCPAQARQPFRAQASQNTAIIACGRTAHFLHPSMPACLSGQGTPRQGQATTQLKASQPAALLPQRKTTAVMIQPARTHPPQQQGTQCNGCCRTCSPELFRPNSRCSRMQHHTSAEAGLLSGSTTRLQTQCMAPCRVAGSGAMLPTGCRLAQQAKGWYTNIDDWPTMLSYTLGKSKEPAQSLPADPRQGTSQASCQLAQQARGGVQMQSAVLQHLELLERHLQPSQTYSMLRLECKHG